MAFYDRYVGKRRDPRDDWRDDEKTHRPKREQEGAQGKGSGQKEQRKIRGPQYKNKPDREKGSRQEYSRNEDKDRSEKSRYGHHEYGQGSRGDRPEKGHYDHREHGQGPRGDRSEKGHYDYHEHSQGSRGDRPEKGHSERGQIQHGDRFEKKHYDHDGHSGRRDAYAEHGHSDNGTDYSRGDRIEYGGRPDYNRGGHMDHHGETEHDREFDRENLLIGRNPIREALKAERDMEKLLIAKGELMGSAREIISMARDRHVVIQEVDRSRLDAMAPNHQGMIAVVSAYSYKTMDDIFALAAEKKEDAFIIILDGITDPHNLGAIIRSAECAGAHGVIIPTRRAAGLTPAAVKASAGAVEHIPVVREVNLSRTLEQLKKEGVWVFGTSLSGKNYRNADYSGPVALVIGSEGEGISKLVAEHCDDMISIPLKGKIESLNASVAAGILMFTIAEKRGGR